MKHLLLIFAATPLVFMAGDRTANAADGKPARRERPNIIFIMADDK